MRRTRVSKAGHTFGQNLPRTHNAACRLQVRVAFKPDKVHVALWPTGQARRVACPAAKLADFWGACCRIPSWCAPSVPQCAPPKIHLLSRFGPGPLDPQRSATQLREISCAAQQSLQGPASSGWWGKAAVLRCCTGLPPSIGHFLVMLAPRSQDLARPRVDGRRP